MNSYTIELRVELPENAAQYMARRVQRDGAIDLDERDWLANLVQGSVLATLVTRVERFPVPHRGDVTVHAYRATRDRIAEDPEAESYDTDALMEAHVQEHRALGTVDTREEHERHLAAYRSALSAAGQEKVRRMFARGAAESEAQEPRIRVLRGQEAVEALEDELYQAYAEETGAVMNTRRPGGW